MVDSLTKSSGNIITGVGIILIAIFMRNLTRPDTQEISFQHFKTQLLAKDVVDRIEVANKTTAKVPLWIHITHLSSCLMHCCHVTYIGFRKLRQAGNNSCNKVLHSACKFLLVQHWLSQ